MTRLAGLSATFLRGLSFLCMFAGLSISASAVAAEPGKEGSPEELRAAIDELAEPFSRAGHLSGTLLVAQADQVIYERSFGQATSSPPTPNSTDTPFNIASVTKPMTAAIAYQLIDEGKLKKETPLSYYLPDFPRGDEIEVRHLLFHLSGLPHRVTSEEDEQVQQTAESMAALAAKAELLGEPGKKRSYSSAGFAVLARVLELASGKSYSQLLNERVVKPLGLEATAHPDGSTGFPARSQSFRFSRDGLAPAPSRNYSFLVGAGSIYSIPRDLHKVMRALVQDRFGESARKGLLRLGKLEWNGMTDGYRAYADYTSKDELSVVFAGNLNSGAVDYLRSAIPSVVNGEPVPEPPVFAVEPVDVPTAELERIAGSYGAPGQALEFTVEDGMLHASGWPLYALGNGRFFSPTDYGTLQVVTDDSGAPQKIDWYQRGKPYSYERQP